MASKMYKEDQGFTLMEITIAIAIFAIVMGSAAQVLISFHVSMDIQRQRYEAIQNCQTVLNAMRDARDADPDNFPSTILEQWPDGITVEDAGTLPNEIVRVIYTNPATTPLEISAISSWSDMRGRTAQTSIATVLTDR